MGVSDRGKVGCSHTARDLWLPLRLVSGPRNLLTPHPSPPTLKVSISAVPRNPVSMLGYHNGPVYVVFVKYIPDKRMDWGSAIWMASLTDLSFDPQTIKWVSSTTTV